MKREIIAERIRNKIITESLKEGERILGATVASAYKVNLKTASEAILLLRDEGLLLLRSGVGSVVAAGAREMAIQRGLGRIQKGLPAMVARAKILGMEEETFLILVKNAFN